MRKLTAVTNTFPSDSSGSKKEQQEISPSFRHFIHLPEIPTINRHIKPTFWRPRWGRDYQYQELLPNPQNSTAAHLTEFHLGSFPPSLKLKPSLFMWQCWQRSLARSASITKVKLTDPSFFRAGSPFTPLSPFHIYLCTSFLPCSSSVRPSKSWTSRTVRKIQVSFIHHSCACSLWSSLLTSRFMSSVTGIVR